VTLADGWSAIVAGMSPAHQIRTFYATVETVVNSPYLLEIIERPNWFLSNCFSLPMLRIGIAQGETRQPRQWFATVGLPAKLTIALSAIRTD